MINFQRHIIHENQPLGKALDVLNNLDDLILFVVDMDNKLIGTLTDGDARRGLLNGFMITDCVGKFMNKSFFHLKNNINNISSVIEAKKRGLKVVPVVDDDGRIKKLINFSYYLI